MNMAAETLAARGLEVKASDIIQMRERIQRELSRETEGYDVKLGPGGIEEIEFVVQFMQLKNCRKDKRLLVQGTLVAMDRLYAAGIIDSATRGSLKDAYLFFRRLESFLRLCGETILRRDMDVLKNASDYMGLDRVDAFVETLHSYRENIRKTVDQHLIGP
jgi:glutamate-ammonia-ligase adenylyltransferase